METSPSNVYIGGVAGTPVAPELEAARVFMGRGLRLHSIETSTELGPVVLPP